MLKGLTMADENRDIKKLIKLQKQRPAFSRMISWEISQAAEYQPVKKGKRKKKKATDTDTENCAESPIPDENENISDDSSEYETACEEEDWDEVRGQSMRESEGHLDSIDSDVLDSISSCNIDNEDEEEEDEDEDELFMSCMGNDTSAHTSYGQQEQGRRRRLSKRQKRKRRSQFKEMYLDDLYNLGNLFDATEEINDVFTDVLAAGPDVTIQHRVPTLAELCLKVNRRKQRHSSEKEKTSISTEKQKTELPVGMKKLISHWGWSQKQLENQLSFLLNKVLPLVEDKIKSKELIESINTETNKNPNPAFPKRSVWVNLPMPPLKSMLEGYSYGSEKTPAFLFTPSTHYHHEIENLEYAYKNYYCFYTVTLNDALWALCTTIDLMLPSQTGSVSATTSIFRIKRALKLRYKTLVDVLFENALPYVMWARGRIAIATDMFRNLIEKETETDTKAMYLSEIARMHAMFGDTNTAEQFYRLATETAVEECNGERRDRCINEATEQKQILLASIYDTGVLDEEKALQSYNFWTGVKSIPAVRTSTLIAGLDALLCYHLSHWPVTGSKTFDEAISKVEKVIKECEYAYYYQSMLHALNGSSDTSTRLYRQSRSCGMLTPGEAVLSLMGHRARNPWQPLIDLINSQTLEVKPLMVIWRTNLQPPRITSHGPMEGQVNSRELNLRLNDAGHVTGDMQMMMPPMRDISLNPYTGFLMMENQPSHTGIWTSACLESNDFHCYDLLVPTYRLIFSGDDGTTVHMLKPSNSKSSFSSPSQYSTNGPPCPFILQWMSPDGQVAKLNLHNLLKKKTFKKTRKAIELRKDTYITNWHFTEPIYLKLFQVLDIAAEKNFNINENAAGDAVRGYDLKRAEKKKRNKGGNVQMPKKPLSSYIQSNYLRYLNWEIMCEPYIFGKAVLLQVMGIDRSVFHIIINTENKNTFQSCKINKRNGYCVVQEQFRDNYTEEEYCMIDGNSDLFVLDKNGHRVLSCSIQEVVTATKNGSPPVIVYPKIFGVTQEKDSIWCFIFGIGDDVDEIRNIGDNICWTIGSVYEELSDAAGNGPYVKELTYIGKSVSSVGKLLMANLHYGLAFIDPGTLEYVPIKLKEGCAKHFEFTKDHNAMKGDFENVKILTEKVFTVDDRPVYRVAFGLQNKVFVLELTDHPENSTKYIEMIFCVVLPGFPKEVCFVGKEVGLLISFTQHNDISDKYYREHVFYFDFDGLLHGVLLCLSHGPRSFLPVYLQGNEDNEGQGEGRSQGGWHVYLRDGRDGIMCVRLH